MELPTADVRRFLAAAFSDEELDALCFDYFPRVYDDFASGMTKGQKIQALIEHCQRHGHMDSLAGALQKERGEQYAEWFASAPAAAEIPRRPRDPRQVFISHARLDAEFAHRLAEDLRNRGWAVWIAPESIRPGEKWVAAIERGLAESGIFLAVVTPNALQSRWVKTETQDAIAAEHEGQVRVIPLLAAPCDVTGLLKTYQQVSFLRSYEDGLSQLIGVLGGRPAEGEDQKPVEAPKRPVIQSIRSRWMLWVALLAVLAVAAVIVIKLIIPSPSAAPAAQAPGLVGTQAVTPSSQVLTAAAAVTSSAGVSPDLVLDLGLGVTMEFVYVPGGEFVMGSNPLNEEGARQDEYPPHTVSVSGFYIGRTEVTRRQFASFALDERSGYTIPSAAEFEYPVADASWYSATEFADWMTGKTGWTVRLPTEAEWEMACRNSDGRIYPWGNVFDSTKANTIEGGPDATTRVGKYSPAGDSFYGAADLAGNVWEWVADWYGQDTYGEQANANPPVLDPQGPASGQGRVLRGGSYHQNKYKARCATRYGYPPAGGLVDTGFRVVAVPPPPPSLTLELAPGVTMDFVRVPAGTFLMGSDPAKDKNAQSDEQPQHQVYVSDFYVGVHEVTNAQYAVFARETGKSFDIPSGKENHPVVDVSWSEAVEFGEWLSRKVGRDVRLPTEAEWEKAARGADGRIYPWGNRVRFRQG